MLNEETAIMALEAVKESLMSWERVKKLKTEQPTDSDMRQLMDLSFGGYLDMVKTVCYILEKEGPSEPFREFGAKVGLSVDVADILTSDTLRGGV